jgi:hypothetical protein
MMRFYGKVTTRSSTLCWLLRAAARLRCHSVVMMKPSDDWN